jgi:hypothetical protein
MVHINAPLFARTSAAGVSGHQVLPTQNGNALQPSGQPLRKSAAGSGFQAPLVATPTKPGTAMKTRLVQEDDWFLTVLCVLAVKERRQR